jgi:hypothetical protein
MLFYVLFATMRSGPRINADDIAPSYGLLLTFRGEKYVQYYTVIQRQYYYVKAVKERSVTWGGGQHCMMPASLQSDSMLDVNCPIPPNHWPHPFPKPAPFSTPQENTCNTICLTMKMTSACGEASSIHVFILYIQYCMSICIKRQLISDSEGTEAGNIYN